MEDDLNNSLLLLEHAASTSRGLLKNTLLKEKTSKKRNVNLSITLRPEELEYLESHGMDVSEYDNSYTDILDATSLTGTVIRNNPWKKTVDVLYMEFLEVLQSRTAGSTVLDVISELHRCCADALSVLRSLKSKVHVYELDEELWLENERNIWKLVHVLYQNRLHSLALQDDDMQDTSLAYFGSSEKKCVESLFQRDQLVRESQIVIDWLEKCAMLRDYKTLHFSGNTMGWENTLHELKMQKYDGNAENKEMVSHLDPDAPHYEKLPLHSLDMEDERVLCYEIFRNVRCGLLDEVQNICENCGHSWRASLFEGWKLYHNPNMENDGEIAEQDEESWDTLDIIGNPRRDVWKCMAWKYSDLSYLNEHEKAATAVYCGNLNSILSVSKDWADYLWAYMKVMVDIRVESEIRDNISKRYKSLPEEYWAQKMSINEVFAALESSTNSFVSTEAAKPAQIIIKLIVLDEIEKLMSKIEEMLDEPLITTHFLRFLTHLVLFFENIGRTQRRDVIERVLESYISRLMQMHETLLVAFYVSKMGSHAQVQIFASYLEKITDTQERLDALELGDKFELDIRAVSKWVVENIRKYPHAVNSSGDLQEKITEADNFKISALDWVLFFEDQKAEALIQSNGLIFTFLTLRKLDAAQLVYNKLPNDILDYLLSKGNPSDGLNQAIHEHLSYKCYLEAQEGFNTWFKTFKSRPIAPMKLKENAQFTEKVTYEHQMSQFSAEMGRWKLTTNDLAKVAKTLLYNVLLFPKGGWLCGAKDADFLRSTCIPECVLLLYSVLYESEMHKECVQLADVLASEKHQLYKAYTKEKLAEILTKICESSMALLKNEMDSFGNELAA